ncbi:diaminobutyrate--2-oxoglutarate aminotransferase [Platysternon megacephalum]|uniref:Diaminobutyrate--2-oxoglutarate aminotransferase n=1 Tax=Platysternon megacephalum TaxID=55544 RepID=A0A4D9DL44_9SAUR|nr:diaminobutyrate--2-oxoglutarate aminotransferase [Platysternon megacephalum]
MRTYHFSADTQEDMNGWIRAMSQSAAAESDPRTISSRPPELLSRPAPLQARLFQDIRPLTPDLGPAKSVESLEIARLSGPHSSAESLSATGRGAQGEGGPLPSGHAPPPSPVNGEGLGGELQSLSSLSSRILRGQEPSAAERPQPGPPRPSPPPCPPESEQPPLEPPSPWEPSADAQSHVRSSRSYSLPPTPAELRGARGEQGGAGASSGRVRAPELAASCEELPLLVQAGSSLARPHTPVGRVDIAPGGAARGSRTIPGRPQAPADRYDVRLSEEPCARPPCARYPRSPHPSHCLARPGTPAEESPAQTATLGPALGRQPRSRVRWGGGGRWAAGGGAGGSAGGAGLQGAGRGGGQQGVLGCGEWGEGLAGGAGLQGGGGGVSRGRWAAGRGRGGQQGVLGCGEGGG